MHPLRYIMLALILVNAGCKKSSPPEPSLVDCKEDLDC